jgi:hypothetical protein
VPTESAAERTAHTGYPGIPSGADRPEAAVKGTIELRAGNQGVRAKWIRIELRKVETLPGGGQSNTFFDHVGQSPVNVWQTTSEYELLHIVRALGSSLPRRHLYAESASNSKITPSTLGYPSLYPLVWRWKRTVRVWSAHGSAPFLRAA